MNRNEYDDTRQQRVNVAKKRDLISFWILGLCNNYGYVVMLTAATDIINSDTVSKTIKSFQAFHDMFS